MSQQEEKGREKKGERKSESEWHDTFKSVCRIPKRKLLDGYYLARVYLFTISQYTTWPYRLKWVGRSKP